MPGEADDPFDLTRFTRAQRDVFDTACAELAAGRKQSHWMWFIFPQLRALGRSDRAAFYGISGRSEAEAFVAHPVLGPRLVTATAAALSSGERDPRQLMGAPDDMKLRSCLTLFIEVMPTEAVLSNALAAFFDGKPDDTTLALLNVGAVGRSTA